MNNLSNLPSEEGSMLLEEEIDENYEPTQEGNQTNKNGLIHYLFIFLSRNIRICKVFRNGSFN